MLAVHSTRNFLAIQRKLERERTKREIAAEVQLARELRTQHPNIYLTRTQALLEARRILERNPTR